jgi:DNA polymerase-3 subunit alpha
VFTLEEFKNASLRRKLCISTTSKELKDAMAMLPPSGAGNTKVCFYLSDIRKIIAPQGELSVDLTREYYMELIKIFPPDKTAFI